METNKNIDELFKQKLSEQEFQFNESAWEKADQMILSAGLRKKERKVALWWFLLPVVFLLGLGSGALIFDEKEEVISSTQTASILEDSKAAIASENSENKTTEITETHEESTSVNSVNASSKTPRVSKRADSFLADNVAKNESKTNYTDFESQNESRDLITEDNTVAERIKDYITLMKRLKINLIKGNRAGLITKWENHKTPHPILKRFSAYLQVGMNASRGFINTGNTRADWSFTPSSTLKLSFLISDMATADIGVSYHYRGGLNSEATYIDETQVSNLTGVQLHYIDIPLSITYREKRSSYIIGMQYSQLVAAKQVEGTISTNSYGQLVENNKETWTSAHTFAPVDVAPMLGYEYVLTERLSGGAQATFGLFDITEDGEYRNHIRDNNLDVKCYLQYNFLK